MKKKKGLILLLLLLAAGGGIAFLFFTHDRNHQGTSLPVSGTIEVTTVELAFKIPGKIEKLFVEEGDFVKEGQLIAALEHRDLLAQRGKAKASLEAAAAKIPALTQNIEFQDQASSQEISQAEAATEAAQFRLQQLLAGSRPQEIHSAKAGVDQALADMEKRKADMERAKKLFGEHYISAQDWDAARTSYEMAAANYQKARENYALVSEGPRREEIDQARAQVHQSQAALRLAQTRKLQVEVLRRELAMAQAQVREAASSLEIIATQIAYSNLYAPVAGVVLVKNREPGEFIVPGAPVITLGDLRKPWLKAFIHEDELGRVKIGQTVVVTTDSYPGKTYTGQITFISSEAEFTPKNVQTVKERVKLVYRIKVALPNPENELKPGMPADGRIQLK